MSAYVSIPAKGLKIPRIAQVMKLTCEFDRYEDGKLWYWVMWSEPHPNPPPALTGDKWNVVETSVFEFPIPVDDAGAGEFTREMKALHLMRWIRKHIEFLNEAHAAEDGA